MKARTMAAPIPLAPPVMRMVQSRRSGYVGMAAESSWVTGGGKEKFESFQTGTAVNTLREISHEWPVRGGSVWSAPACWRFHTVTSVAGGELIRAGDLLCCLHENASEFVGCGVLRH